MFFAVSVGLVIGCCVIANCMVFIKQKQWIIDDSRKSQPESSDNINVSARRHETLPSLLSNQA